jgi:hypothetical protein
MTRRRGGFLRIAFSDAPRGGDNPAVWRVAGLRVLRLSNPIVRGVLRSPVHPFLSGQLALLTYCGHRTGRRYTIPLRYAEMRDGRIVALAVEPRGKEWWRSFAVPRPATITLRGSRLSVRGALTEGETREDALDDYVARHRRSRGIVRGAAVVVFVADDASRRGSGPRRPG